MEIAIVEDEKVFQNQLIRFINEWCYEHKTYCNISTYMSGSELIQQYDPKYNVIFMDIMMPKDNGMQTAKYIRKTDIGVPIIFVTSSPEYAIESYEVQALHYLIKPVTYQTIANCMKKITDELNHKHFIIVPIEKSYTKIITNNIIYIESRGHYVEIHAINETYIIRKNISDIALELPGIFIQCHRSAIVNITYVIKFNKDTITTSTGDIVFLSESYYDNIANAFIQNGIIDN